MAEWFKLSEQEVMSGLKTSPEGLGDREAEKRLSRYGENIIQEDGRKQWWQVFLEQFQDLLVIILIVAAGISMVTGDPGSAGVICAVLLLNALLGTVQHEKAQKSLDSLKQLSSQSARVRRQGKLCLISAAQVVPGDILLLEAGDLAAADARLLDSAGLQVNESSLTGESLNVDKHSGILGIKAEKQPDSVEKGIPLAERTNMVFSGSLITAGRGRAVVTATGMDTEIGKIAALMNSTREQRTPLQVSLDRFSSRLAAAIMLISALVFGVSIYRREPALDALMFAVALAVAAIPEALSSIVTIVQAMGTQKMAREQAIIKDLRAVESLGCVSVICSDKTGTLTRNRLKAEKIFVNLEEHEPGWLGEAQSGEGLFLKCALLANNAQEGKGGGCGGLTGDPVDCALVQMAEEAGADIGKMLREAPRLGEIPFDSRRKYMAVLHRERSENCFYIKGAVDVLLERCSRIAAQGEQVRRLNGWDREQILRQNESWSNQGFRVLAFAMKPQEGDEAEPEGELIFLGLCAMMDPPRRESRGAVLAAREAGIRVIMITGDHPTTASAIARQTGILEPGGMVLTGTELDQMGDRELDSILERVSVYARVSPEHKIRIVEAWQKRGQIVAMTGDGVNDGPALKKADIGVAMGLSGTDVSRDAAAMILADDNFATIIKAVANGRNVYRNIKNAVQFLLSGNMAGIFCVLYASLRGLPMPFAPVHLLFINLLTDSLPAIAIGMEPPEEGLLQQPPRDPGEGILTGRFIRDILVQGGMIGAASLWPYYVGLSQGGEALASTMTFSTLTLARLFHGFNCRSRHSMLHLGFSGNPYSVIAFELGVVLLLAVLFVPGLQVLFAAADLSLFQLATVAACAFTPTLIIQALKTCRECLE